MLASSLAASFGSRVRSPAIVSRHGSSANVASAATSTSNPFRGTTAPTDSKCGTSFRLPARPRRRIAAGPCHRDALGRYAIIGSDKFCGCRARHHDFAHRSQGSLLTAMQGIGSFGRQPPFQRQGMMNQREQRMPACNFCRNVRQDSQCQAVHHDRLAVRYLQQKRSRGRRGSPRPAKEILRRCRDIRRPSPIAGVRP